MPAKYNLPRPPSLLRTLGPSFVLLGLALGTGELILWPYLAANYGLGLLWGGLLGISFQFVLNTEVIRYSLAKGESVFVGFRKLSILIPIWYVISTLIPWSLPGFSSATAQIIARFGFGNEKFLAIFLLVLVGVILSSGKMLYQTIEKIQKYVILISLPVVFILAFLLTDSLDWQQALWGLIGKGDGWWFFPTGISIASFLGAFAYAGAGGNLNLAQSYYVKEKGFGMGKYSEKIKSLFNNQKSQKISLDGHSFKINNHNKNLWKKWWRLVCTEHFLVFWLLGFLTIVVMAVLAKSLVFGNPVESGLSFLYTEASVISHRLGNGFGIGFLLMAAVMILSTHLGILESSSRIISENVILLGYRKNKKYNLSVGFYIALWLQIILGILIYLSGWQEPRMLLTLSAILNAAAMMMSFLFIYWLNKKKLVSFIQPGRLRKIIMLLAVAFFAVFLISVLIG
jgi:hypothetical protein